MRSYTVMAILGVAAGVAASFMGACSNQPEGSRCDKLGGDTRAVGAGSDDCEAPLVCTSAEELLWPAVGEAGAQRPSTNICCPADRTQATTDVCKLKTTPITQDGSTTDTGSPMDAQPDVQTDTGTPDSGTPDAADAADQ